MVVWQLFNLKKEWRMGDKVKDVKSERVYKYRAPIVSFVKIGSSFKVSKSETINRTLFAGANRVFMQIHFTYEMQEKKNSLGMIDLAFAGPELTDEEEKKPDLPDLLTVLNFHGNPKDFK